MNPTFCDCKSYIVKHSFSRKQINNLPAVRMLTKEIKATSWLLETLLFLGVDLICMLYYSVAKAVIM